MNNVQISNPVLASDAEAIETAPEDGEWIEDDGMDDDIGLRAVEEGEEIDDDIGLRAVEEGEEIDDDIGLRAVEEGEEIDDDIGFRAVEEGEEMKDGIELKALEKRGKMKVDTGFRAVEKEDGMRTYTPTTPATPIGLTKKPSIISKAQVNTWKRDTGTGIFNQLNNKDQALDSTAQGIYIKL
jgi:hypothetical protein